MFCEVITICVIDHSVVVSTAIPTIPTQLFFYSEQLALFISICGLFCPFRFTVGTVPLNPSYWAFHFSGLLKMWVPENNSARFVCSTLQFHFQSFLLIDFFLLISVHVSPCIHSFLSLILEKSTASAVSVITFLEFIIISYQYLAVIITYYKPLWTIVNQRIFPININNY